MKHPIYYLYNSLSLFGFVCYFWFCNYFLSQCFKSILVIFLKKSRKKKHKQKNGIFDEKNHDAPKYIATKILTFRKSGSSGKEWWQRPIYCEYVLNCLQFQWVMAKWYGIDCYTWWLPLFWCIFIVCVDCDVQWWLKDCISTRSLHSILLFHTYTK